MTARGLDLRRSSWRRFQLALALLWGLAGCTASASREAQAIRSQSKLEFVPLDVRGANAHEELTGLLFLPDDLGLLVWEKAGRVAHYALERDALVLQGETQLPAFSTGTDCGLISLVLDPDWRENHFLYAAHCTSPKFSAVTRYRFDGHDAEAIARSGVPVLEFGDPQAKKDHHNVGTIGFFPDALRSMWILVGDKKNPENAQDPSTGLGGILRIVPNRGDEGGYEPHPDNPFGGPGADPSLQSNPNLYAWGLRSPWRGAIDDHGRIWIGEVGNAIEEINLATTAGQNFGWGLIEGPCMGRCEATTDPIAFWGRGSNHEYRLEDDIAGPTVRRVAWIGTPYRENDHDPYDGLLDDAILFGDMCVGFVRALAVDADGKRVRDEPVGHLEGLSGAAQGPDGHLYVTSYGACTSDVPGTQGGIYRVVLRKHDEPKDSEPEVPRGLLVDAPLGKLPEKLSDTGIFMDALNSKPIARVIRYEPTWPLWSNGSDKERWLLLPEGGRVDNGERSHWQFPVGTLFFKTFDYAGEGNGRLETRIIRRTRSGWDYHAYRWRGSDAELLSLEEATPVAVQLSRTERFDHQVPSRFDCRSCHESNKTVIIGFDELRLNSRLEDHDTTQLEELAERGVFTHSLPSPAARIEHEDPQTREVLGYLHGNCAHCHNASESTMSVLDLSFDRALDGILGREVEGSGQATGVRVVRGVPEQSVLFLAVSGEGDDPELQPMPPLGVQRKDAQAIELLRDWIRALPSDSR